jgi:AraC-like DNA-binding protein
MAGRKTNLSGFNSIKRQQELERDWDEEQAQIKFYVSSEIILYSIEDIIRMSGWSETTVQRLFNDPRFPAIDYGKRKLVENHALMRFLSVRHEKARDWR